MFIQTRTFIRHPRFNSLISKKLSPYTFSILSNFHFENLHRKGDENRKQMKSLQFTSMLTFIRVLTLEFLIALGPRLLIFESFSTPYALIRDPMLIYFGKFEPNPLQSAKFLIQFGHIWEVLLLIQNFIGKIQARNSNFPT